MDIVQNARAIATKAHTGQMRKYNNSDKPYITHPDRVATRLTFLGAPAAVVAAGWVHDVYEDTTYPLNEIYNQIGKEAFYYMLQMTNPSKLLKDVSRGARKSLDRFHLARACEESKVIKLVDRIDNLQELIGAPEEFQKLYANESLMLLSVLHFYPEDGRDSWITRDKTDYLRKELSDLIKNIIGVEEFHKTRIIGQ